MSDEPTWTDDEIAEFDRLTLEMSSRDQVIRINGRMDMNRFVDKHGRAKCDAMFEEIKRREAEDRKRSRRK